MMRNLLLMAAGLLGLIVTAGATAQAPSILVLGDSLSAGYGMAQNQGWVSLLQQRLKERRFPYQVVNASISGETSRGALSRLDTLLERHDPEIVVLELGANDGLQGMPLTQMRTNLASLIEKSRTAGAKVLLVGMQLPPNYGPAYTQQFQEMYKELAEKPGVGFVPFLLAGIAEDLDMFQTDRIHPTAEAQPRMLENVWTELRKLLESTRRTRLEEWSPHLAAAAKWGLPGQTAATAPSARL